MDVAAREQSLSARQWILAVLTVGLVAGSLAATIGYALYLRSDWYRTSVERELSAFFQLPSEVGSVVPLSTTSREFRNVAVWLPDRRARVFQCGRAIWREGRRDRRSSYELEIHDGRFLIGTERWQPSDYRRVLRSGLAHDFAELNLDQVRVVNVDFACQRPDLQLAVRQATGVITFEQYGRGHATLNSHWLNQTYINNPIDVAARFSPSEDVTIDEVTLRLPAVPVVALGLGRLVGGEVTHGRFAGTVTYAEQAGQYIAELQGYAADVRLAELTARLPTGPLRGRASVFIDHARIVGGRLDELRFRGSLSELDLSSFGTFLRQPIAGGTAQLEVHQAHLRGRSIEQFSASGSVVGMDLETITRLIGQGTVTGTLVARIRSLEIAHDDLVSADVELHADPPEGSPGMIDTELLMVGIEQAFAMRLRSVLPDWLELPDQVQYAKLGARLVVANGKLRVLGTHGPEGRTILSIKLFGRELPLVPQPEQEYDLVPFLSGLRHRAKEYNVQELRRWWDEKQRRTTQPSATTKP